MARRGKFGAVTDNPREIFKTAERELANAKSRLDRRQAAEKAHLALSSAIERAAGRNLETYGAELKEVQKLARRLKAPGLEAQYRRVRQGLHGDCFHQDRCSTLEKDFGKAEVLLDLVLGKKR